MVATDTVVGIVGAVVLVAVMAGVFAYEYNNTPDEASSQQARQEHFEEDFPGLAATDDLDGDGTANYEDGDLDGDGQADTEDDMLAVAVPVSGSLGQRTTTQEPYTQAFAVGNGSEALEGTLTYTKTGVAQLGVGLPAFAARIVDASGQTVANAQSTTSGNTATLSFAIAEPLPAGEYTLEVSQPNAGPGGSFSGQLDVHYATPVGGAHGHDA